MGDESALKRIRTGIEVIDGGLGGFIAGKAYLVYGEPGTGKTVLSLQFLNEGLVEGETCGLVTQENPADLLTMGRHIGLTWRDYLASGRLIILQYRPNFALHFSKSFSLKEVFQELRELSHVATIDRLVFDPITPVVDCVNRLNYTKVFQELFALLEALGSTTVLTLDEVSGIHGSPFLRTLISLAFGAIHLRISPDLHRKMFFQKLKYQSELVRPATYTIEPLRGIVLLPSGEKTLEQSKVQKKILVADDDEKTCDRIRRMLGDKYALTFVHDGIDVLTKIVNNPLDLIVLAASLPGIDGFDVLRRLRAQGSSIPIFLISGKRRRTQDKVNGFNLGADEYMLKPLNPLELESRIQAILQRGRDSKHPVLHSVPVLGEDGSGSRAMDSKEQGPSPCLSSLLFRERVKREMEKVPSNLFSLVSYQFEGMDGRERAELTNICTQVLASSVRRNDDFVGNLGKGRVCVFLKGATEEASIGFVKRTKRRILRAAKGKIERSAASIRVKTRSATFPADGKDLRTLQKDLVNHLRKS